MRSPFKQGNSSSSSLEGMERPVRSFKSFIKTVPPNPSHPRNNKPLPPAPSSSKRRQSPPRSESTSLSPRRTSSVTSWRAPAEWTTSGRRKDSQPATPISTARRYSPLLPDPFPDNKDTFMEISAAQGEASGAQRARLMPIYERSNPAFRPPRDPPKSPLPTPPARNPRRLSKEAPISPTSEVPSPPAPETSAGQSSEKTGIRSDSPAQSVQSNTSNRSTKEKAFASLGIEPPRDQPGMVANRSYSYPSPGPSTPRSTSQSDPSVIRPDRRYLKERRLLAFDSKGQTLEDDSSVEDLDINESTRQLSVLQDYHGVLREGKKNDLRDSVSRHHDPSPPHNTSSKEPKARTPVKPAHKDRHLVPPPLSWSKPESTATSRCVSQTRHDSSDMHSGTTSSSHTKKQRLSNKITGWVPRRLSVGPKRTEATHNDAKSTNGNSKNHVNGAQKSFGRSKEEKPTRKQKQKAGKAVPDDLLFSAFFPSAKPRRYGKKPDASTGPVPTLNKSYIPTGQEHIVTPWVTTAPPPPPPPPSPPPKPQVPGRIMRVPGLGISLIRTPPPERRSEEGSIHSNAGPGSAWMSSTPHSPTSMYNSSEHRSSFNPPLSPTPIHPVAPSRSPWRISTATMRSHKTGSSTQHPLAQEIKRSPETQSAPTSQPWDELTPDPDRVRKQNFFEKAMEARRQHAIEARHQKLKKSIRVLGPTDPTVVEYVAQQNKGDRSPGHEVRMPGYMVSGPV